MMLQALLPNFVPYVGLDSLPLQNGYIYIGTVNLNPEVNPITVYWDSAGTQPAAQPIRTLNGFPARNGTPANIFINSQYSITVRDKNLNIVYNQANSAESFAGHILNFFNSIGSSLIGFIQAGAGAILRNIQDKGREWVTFEDFGAVGNGVFDDTIAVNAALATGFLVRGLKSKIYAVSGNITLPDNTELWDAHFKQLSPNNADRRTLIKTTATGKVTLRRVTVDKNGQTTDASAGSNAAGIWIANTNGVILEDCEVFGNSLGIGIFISDCTRIRVIRPYVHDMQWTNAVDPGTEQIVGVWLNNCSDAAVEEPIIKNLTGIIGAGPVRAYQTDGLDFGGSSLFQVRGGRIQNVGEGIDISGTLGNDRFSIIGTTVLDIDSWGFKFANSASNGEVIGCIARDCGYAGFVVSGPSNAGLPLPQDISFIGCRSINAGSNGNWAAFNICGFSVASAVFNLDYPQGIRFIDCEAIDDQIIPTMKYGYRSEPSLSIATIRPNTMRDCYSRGHTIAKTLANIGDMWLSCAMTNVTSTVSGVHTAIKWNSRIEDPYSMLIVNNSAINKAFTFDGAAVFLDETADMNSGVANDVPLFLSVGAALYVGNSDVFNELTINLGTAASSGAVAWEFWNGSAWIAVTGLSDGTVNFTAAAGTYDIKFTIPTTWQQNVVNGTTLYWLRARVTAILTGTPAITQAWMRRDPLIREDGLYAINTQVDFATNAVGTRQIRVLVNGVLVGNTVGVSASNNSTITIASVSSVLRLNRGDQVTIEARQDSGGALNMTANNTFLRLTKMVGRE